MLIIEERPLEEMYRDALQSFPDECCGFLFGMESEKVRRITNILVVNNSKEGDKRRRFEIAPRDYMNAERFAEANDLQFLGIYHSHPKHPALPSEHDRVAAQPYFSYVIISVDGKEIKQIRSWQLNGTLRFEEETIENQFINQQK